MASTGVDEPVVLDASWYMPDDPRISGENIRMFIKLSSGGETDLVACSVRGFTGWGKLKCQCMMDRGLNGQQNQTYPWKVKVMNLLHESPNKSHLFSYDWLGLGLKKDSLLTILEEKTCFDILEHVIINPYPHTSPLELQSRVWWAKLCDWKTPKKGLAAHC
ncbi:hypothetical protein HID58_093699 [Brassica napus]|uniref:Uncharacterized protein n=1 Tax=Brassica napus TaxID=3708 RepID=A0ABQ7XCH9_BRANA|nr:hypothetical protein HID58_093699 [Brassica napus]